MFIMFVLVMLILIMLVISVLCYTIDYFYYTSNAKKLGGVKISYKLFKSLIIIDPSSYYYNFGRKWSYFVYEYRDEYNSRVEIPIMFNYIDLILAEIFYKNFRKEQKKAREERIASKNLEEFMLYALKQSKQGEA